MSEATRVAMLQTAPDGIVFIDEDGAILEFNPAPKRYSASGARSFWGALWSKRLSRPRAGGRLPISSAICSTARAPNSGPQDRNAICAMGQDALVPVELAITEIVQGGRRLFVAYLRDLTVRKRTEAEVTRQRDALHQSEKLTALGSLLAGVAHELNNPLSVVIGRAVMLEEDARDSVQRERLTKLREAAERCARVSKTFLAMARQSPSVRVPTSLNTAITAALELVAYPLRSSGDQSCSGT